MKTPCEKGATGEKIERPLMTSCHPGRQPRHVRRGRGESQRQPKSSAGKELWGLKRGTILRGGMEKKEGSGIKNS